MRLNTLRLPGGLQESVSETGPLEVHEEVERADMRTLRQ